MDRVGFGPRLIAVLLDVGIMFVGGGIASFLFGGLLGGLTGGAAAGVGGAFIGGLFGAIFGGMLLFWLLGVFYGLIEAVTGQSPGKMVMGLIIRTHDGSPAPQSTLFYRYFLKNISLILSLAGGMTGLAFLIPLGDFLGLIVFLGFFMVLGASRQALHDVMAKTAVYTRN